MRALAALVLLLGVTACGGPKPGRGKPGERDCRDACAHQADRCFSGAPSSIEQSSCDRQADECTRRCGR